MRVKKSWTSKVQTMHNIIMYHCTKFEILTPKAKLVLSLCFYSGLVYEAIFRQRCRMTSQGVLYPEGLRTNFRIVYSS